MQAALGYEDLVHATRAQLETSGQLAKWRRQQQQDERKQQPQRASAVARVEICGACQGHRIEKVAYQSMVLERTCAQCDGEGVLVTPPEAAASAVAAAGQPASQSRPTQPRPNRIVDQRAEHADRLEHEQWRNALGRHG